ncbi:hypothetical protein H2198_010697 [Neophaeococcomyces mojaviensis]|uniref:Uncharacterized protein n=1 Tax=Neophaeococcomyces mojaviensis TaxID=3383035 RepID=A0ACC2ZQY2_9EURO|nr:hypothetical protein H2198_010697 [Knufia sp. JES_112]
MNTLHLGRCLGDLTSQAFQRLYLQQQLQSLGHNSGITFSHRPKLSDDDDDDASLSDEHVVAHKAGTNCIAIDQSTGRYLISGGADTGISLWDLESQSDQEALNSNTLRPTATISKATPASHTHAITSLSIYPFDPSPQTLLTTSYDQSLILHSITSTTLTPVHQFPLDFTAYTHAISPASDSTPLVAVGTSHPAPRLIDLRTALATHSLPGHTGAIYSLAWHPHKSHILVSSSTDGRILVFDIRRATPAFASFDVDDTLGIVESNPYISSHSQRVIRPHLNYTHRAHSAPITGILFNSSGDKLISASQDQRIRIWDIATGRNDLVHFGPRIRNSRSGELKPVLAPPGTAGGSGVKSGHELLFWPNDDGRGEIHVHDLREGSLVRVMKTQNVVQVREQQGVRRRGRGGAGAGGAAVNRLTSGGRINAVAWRPVWAEKGEVVEMYTAHGDGRICAWMPAVDRGLGEDEGAEEESGEEDGSGDEQEEAGSKRKKHFTEEELEEERRKKRRRDLIGNLVEGLTKRPVTFS